MGHDHHREQYTEEFAQLLESAKRFFNTDIEPTRDNLQEWLENNTTVSSLGSDKFIQDAIENEAIQEKNDNTLEPAGEP
jgi:hypothetical protein